MKPPFITKGMAEMLFAIEAALPFVESHVGERLCSSAGSPMALKKILEKYDWENQRARWIPDSER